MKRKIRALLLPLGLAAAGCGSDVATGPSAVVGGTWKLASLQRADFSVVQIPQPEGYTVEFEADGQLPVRADCNVCGGSYEISGESLQVGVMACTRAYCGAASVDNEYLAILGSADSFGVADGVLSVHSSEGTLRFTR